MNNDRKILELKKLIDKKEKELRSLPKKSFKTNLRQDLMTNLANNMNVMCIDQLYLFRAFLNMIIVSSKQVNGEDVQLKTSSGYTYQDMKEDADILIDTKEIQIENKKIHDLRNRLNNMLSEKAKVSMELDDIEKYLKG